MTIQLTGKRLAFLVFAVVILFTIIFSGVIVLTRSSSEKANNAATVETPDQFKAKCTQLDYTQLARNPDNYKGQRVVYVGKVAQVQESGNNLVLRVNVNEGESGLWKDTVWVNYTKPAGSNRILENDVVQLWGIVKGLRHYTAIMGNDIAIPEIDAKYLETYNEQASSDRGNKNNTGKTGGGAIQEAQSRLKNKNVPGTVLATSLGNNPNGFLSLTKNVDRYNLVIYDNNNQRAAEVPFTWGTYNFISDNRSPIIFKMTVYNDVQDKDSQAGVWKGNRHTIPVYALYKINSSGIVVPDMLTTGSGENPSHYQGYLNEQKNVDIANLFLTEMAALHQNVKNNNVDIPFD